MSLLLSTDLYCERDDRVLFSGLRFSIDAGEIVQLEGPNGSGKTTLLRILSGLYGAYEGTLLWQGRDIRAQMSEYQSQLLVLGHKSAIKLALNPLENLRYMCGLQGQHDTGLMLDALGRLGLSGYESVPCRNLSAGQVRRVNLARLYLSDARIWLLDEIFTAIDKGGVRQLERLLEQKAQAGVAIAMTTHHAPEIAPLKTLRLGAQVSVA